MANAVIIHTARRQSGTSDSPRRFFCHSKDYTPQSRKRMNSTGSENTVKLEIAGIAVALEIADDDKRASVHERYREFIATDREPQAIIGVKVSPGARFIPMEPGPWIIETSYDQGHLKYRSHFDQGPGG